MMASVVIRPARLGDISFILHGNVVVDEKSHYQAPDQLSADRLKRDVFSENPRAYIDIAEVDGEAAALVFYSFCYYASEGEGVWITNLYVDPFARKAGLGLMLVEHLKKKYPKCSGIYGAVADKNKLARHFFSKIGAIRYEEFVIYGAPNDWGADGKENA